MDGESVTLPTLRFERIGESISLKHSKGFDGGFQYDSVHSRLLASDNWNVFCINPNDFTYRIVCETERWHEINCVHPITGDLVLGCPSGWDVSSEVHFFKLSVDSGSLATISLRGLDLWDFNPLRLIYAANGDMLIVAHKPPDAWDDDDDDSAELHVLRYNSEGYFVSWGDADELTPYSACNNLGLFQADGYAICGFLFEKMEYVVLAGSVGNTGCSDGVGIHASFGKDLRKPILNSHGLFMRMEEPAEKWRMVHLDWDTLRVRTVMIVNLSHDDIVGLCASNQQMFALRACSSYSEEYTVQLFSASLANLTFGSTLLEDCRTLDYGSPVHPFTFRLAGGSTLHMDRRLLMSRSSYFRAMLSSGLHEDTKSEVDLTSDAIADEASLSVLLRFVTTDAWSGPSNDTDLLFRVRALADRYGFPKLVGLADTRLQRLLRPTNTLEILSRVIGSGSPVETACWELMDSDGASIIEENQTALNAVIEQNPELAKQIILWGSRKRRRLNDR